MMPKDTETILEPASSSGDPHDDSTDQNEDLHSEDDETLKKKTGRKLWRWRCEGMTIVVISVIVLSVALTFALVISIIAGVSQVDPHGGVASENQHCSRAGLDIMQRKDGNAVDAAVATALCLTVARPDVSSLGGCGLMLVRNRKTQTSYLFDSMCTSPSGPPTPDAAQPQTLVGVPGYIRGLQSMHTQFGVKPWDTLFGTAIVLATNGFKPGDDLINAAAKFVASNPTSKNPIASTLATIGGGNYKPPTGLVDSLRSLASNGASAFHDTIIQNSLGSRLLTFMNANGLAWKANDLKNYKVEQPQAIEMGFAGFELEAFPTPSTGGPLLLSLLGNLDLKNAIAPLNDHALIDGDPNATATYLHRLIELSRLSELSVSHLGDLHDASVANSANKTQHELFSAETREKLVNSVDDNKLLPPNSASAANPELQIGDTGILVTDSYGLTVVITSYLGSPFGNGQLIPNSGIHLNSALRLFSTTASPDPTKPNLNLISAGRRPLLPVSPIYLSAIHRKCGIRVGVSTSGGIWGMEDAAQVISNALLFLQETKCIPSDGVNPPVATLESDNFIVSKSANANLKSHPKTSRFTPAADNGCVNTDKAISVPRLHADSIVHPNGTIENRVVHEASLNNMISGDLTNMGHNLVTETGPWPGRVAIVGWNGYELISTVDSRGSWKLSFF